MPGYQVDVTWLHRARLFASRFQPSRAIAVPPKAPIVAFETADKTILKPGAKIFVVAAKDGGKLDGKFVAIGKDGLTPPM
jgi:hypothetical protein